ncbi:hypothetical protein ACFVUY_10650 [Kitasatospora sp. NPDC058063]|uniref:hypothetical protein n=1 Tax=unclassified Kitasatospora TaxID=2633591 RepID=UPI0036DA2A21
MKRLLQAAGLAATAVALCLTTVTNASAATGTLRIGFDTFQEPFGGLRSRWLRFVLIAGAEPATIRSQHQRLTAQ